MRKGRALRSALYLFMCITGSAIAGDVTNPQSAIQSAGSCMATAFTANRGQWPDSILFRADVGGAAMWITKTGIYYQFTHRSTEEEPADQFGRLNPSTLADNPARGASKVELIKAEFVGSNPEVSVVGEGELGHKSNFFLGNDPAAWRTDVSNYSRVVFRGLYPGADLTFSGCAGVLECQLAGPSAVRLSALDISYRGARSVVSEGDGFVTLRTDFGDRRFHGVLPVRESPLRISGEDPTESAVGSISLLYSTYLGGGGDEQSGADIAVDDSGYAYVVGTTPSTDFPTQGPFQTLQGFEDVCVTKLSPSGDSLIFSTYLGGSFYDDGFGVDVDGNGNAYVTGTTSSTDFPTENPYQTEPGDDNLDAFVTKLAATGNSLEYSTYLGGGGTDAGYDIAVSNSGNAYITGSTFSIDFPTQSPFQSNPGFWTDAFVTKLSAAGNSLAYSTYLGGPDPIENGMSEGVAISIDDSGYAYVTGHTWNPNFPTLNPYQSLLSGAGTSDVFVTKFSVGGSSLVYSTYLGGAGNDNASGIAMDSSGNAYVAGHTTSTDFPTQSPYQTEPGDANWDVFVTKLAAAGSSLVYSTYLGGGGSDVGGDIAVSSSGNAFVCASTFSMDFPTHVPYQLDQLSTDVVVLELSDDGASLRYSTYLGGDAGEGGTSIAVDEAGSAYVVGLTSSTNFPTVNPYLSNMGGDDLFVTKMESAACSVLMTGDVNTNGTITSADIIALVNYVFKSGAAPMPCVAAGDANCSGSVTSADIIALVNFVFKSGAAPCDVCTIVPSLWSCP